MQRAVDDVALTGVMGLAANPNASPEVRAMALLKLQELRAALTNKSGSPEVRAHYAFATAQISKFELQPEQVLKPGEPLEIPPGAPIGAYGSNGVLFEFDVE